MTSGNIFGLESLNNLDIDIEENRQQYQSTIESNSETTLYRICIEQLRYSKMIDVLTYLIDWKGKSEKCRSNILKSIELNCQKLKLQPKYLNTSELKNMTNVDYKKIQIQSLIEKEYATLSKAKLLSKPNANPKEQNIPINSSIEFNKTSCKFPSKMSIFNLKTSANFSAVNQTTKLKSQKMQQNKLQSSVQTAKENKVLYSLNLPCVMDVSSIKSCTFRNHCTSLSCTEDIEKIIPSKPANTIEGLQEDKIVNISLNLINIVENEDTLSKKEYAETQGTEAKPKIECISNPKELSKIASISINLKKEMKFHFRNRFIKSIIVDQLKGTPRNWNYSNTPTERNLWMENKTHKASKTLILPQDSSMQILSSSSIGCRKPVKAAGK